MTRIAFLLVGALAMACSKNATDRDVGGGSSAGGSVGGDGAGGKSTEGESPPGVIVDYSEAGPAARVTSVLVDGADLYYTANSYDFSVMLTTTETGAGAGEKIAPWSRSGSERFFARDAKAIYWQGESSLVRRDRKTNSIQEIELGLTGLGQIMADDEAIFGATNDCTDFFRVDSETLQVEIAANVNVPDGGNTPLALTDSHVYCGGFTHLYRVDRELSGDPELVLSLEDWWTVQGLVAVGDDLFLLSENRLEGHRLERVSLSDFSREVLVSTHTSGVNHLRFRESEGALYYLSLQPNVVRFELETRGVTTVFSTGKDNDIWHFDFDDSHMYVAGLFGVRAVEL